MAMGQSQTSRFHLKYLKLCSEDDNIVILAWKNSFSEALLWEGLLGHAKNKYLNCNLLYFSPKHSSSSRCCNSAFVKEVLWLAEDITAVQFLFDLFFKGKMLHVSFCKASQAFCITGLLLLEHNNRELNLTELHS